MARRTNDDFDPAASGTSNHVKSVYSDGRDIGETWGADPRNRHGDQLGDCSAYEQSMEGARSLFELERATRLAEGR
jgi:hypothetical protein